MKIDVNLFKRWNFHRNYIEFIVNNNLDGIELEDYEIIGDFHRFFEMLPYEYNEVSRIYDVNDRMIKRTDNSGYWEKYTYDEQGRITYIESSEGCKSKSYVNNTILTKFNEGWMLEVFDYKNRLIFLTDDTYMWSKFDYKDNYNMIETDCLGNQVVYKYDKQGNCIYMANKNNRIICKLKYIFKDDILNKIIENGKIVLEIRKK